MTEENKTKVCDEILEIMECYHEQDARGYVDTPGGLEHMGDVWSLLRKWEIMLKLESELSPTPVEGESECGH